MSSEFDVALPDFLHVAARSHPERMALTFGSHHWTFRQLSGTVAASASWLSGYHTQSQCSGRIGILSANRPGYVFAIFAAARLGRSVVPLNWRQTATDLSWQIRDANVALLLADQDHMATAEQAASGLPTVVHAIEHVEAASTAPVETHPAPPIAFDREAMVIYTSGTSGTPKGVRLTYGNLWHSAVASAMHLGQREDDVWLAALPLFHVGGLSILYRGVIGSVLVNLLDRYTPDSVMAAIEAGATHVSLVPVMLRHLVEGSEGAPVPGALRCALIGGAAAPAELIERSLELGIPVAATYGLTEAASQVATLRPPEARRYLGSSGLPLPVTQVRVVERGQHAAPGEIGEIEIRGPTVFDGYLGGDNRPCDHGTWFATGDSGYLDDAGYLYVVDRREDLIISGGENIAPAEIEAALLRHPLVGDAGVVGLPDDEWGERPHAFVVWRGEPALAESVLIAHCAEQLAGYKIPERIAIVDRIPRSPSGKLLRRSLRERVRGRA